MQVTRVKKTAVSQVIIHMFFIVLSIGFILPLISILSISLSNDIDMAKHGYSLIPRNFDATSYQFLFRNPGTLLNSYKVTFIMSISATLLYLLIASMCAYPLSRMSFKYRNSIMFLLFFTMLFNGGLAPYYILMTKYLKIRNSYMALILPLLGGVWYLFLMRTFFRQLPASIIESATIDGCSEFKIYARIILPLSTPVLATVGLLKLLENWNSWYHVLLFIDKSELYPLQYMLQVMLRNILEMLGNMGRVLPPGVESAAKLPTESIRMAMCILAIGPMLFVFPFFQKYFTQGLTVGALKD
jgi:putative aldouronate transport system permease protein